MGEWNRKKSLQIEFFASPRPLVLDLVHSSTSSRLSIAAPPPLDDYSVPMDGKKVNYVD